MTLAEDYNQDENTHSHHESVFTATPQPIVSMLGVKIKQIAVGREHCMVLTSDGIVYVWGDNSRNQLGMIVSEEELRKPRTKPSTKKLPEVQSKSFSKSGSSKDTDDENSSVA